jgi:hypothetical protein
MLWKRASLPTAEAGGRVSNCGLAKTGGAGKPLGALTHAENHGCGDPLAQLRTPAESQHCEQDRCHESSRHCFPNRGFRLSNMGSSSMTRRLDRSQLLPYPPAS